MDYSQAPDLKDFSDQVFSTLHAWFDGVNSLLESPNYEPVPAFSVTFDAEYDGVAYASGNRIVGSVNYYRTHQDDVGSMIHEMTHVIQKYNNCAGWLTEGIADWVRYYNFEPNRKPGKPGPDNHWTDGYGVSAYFLQWIQKLDEDRNMIYWANKDCREGTYNDDLWPRLTGSTLEQLWAAMQADGPI